MTATDRHALRQLRQEIQAEVSILLGERALTTTGSDETARVHEFIGRHVDDFQRRAVTLNTPPLADAGAVERRLTDDLLGMGPLEVLLRDDAVEEIFVNHPRHVATIRDGRKQLEEDIDFETDEEVQQLVKRVIGPLGARLDAASPMVDVRLPDGSRLNAVIPPISTWCAVTIRKFLRKTATLDELVARDMLPVDAADFLRAAVQAGATMLISGLTGSGKTTLLGALASEITAPSERIIVIEEVPELGLERRLPDCVAMQARAPNVEGVGAVTIRQLVRNALRQRPTRLILGEIRSAEALDVLTALTTGHDGSMSTVHAASPRDALGRFVVLAQLAEERFQTETLWALVAQTIDMVVQLQMDHATNRRRVSGVWERTGLEAAGGMPVITGQELWAWDPRQARLVWTGLRPRCLDRMRARGVAYALPTAAPATPDSRTRGGGLS